MKVLIISPNPVFGGAATANMAIAEVLSNNHEVIYCDEYLDGKMIEKKTVNYIVDDYKIHGNKFNIGFKFFRYVKQINPDTIIWGNYMVSIYYILAIMYFGIFKKYKQCYIFHSTALEKNFKGEAIDWIVSFLTIFMDRLIFVSNYTKNSWGTKFFVKLLKKEKHIVIHNPIMLNVNIDKNSKSDFCKISYVGRVSSEKQPDLFCEIAAGDSKIERKYYLWGDGPLENSIKAKYHGTVEFKGFESNMTNIYFNTDILILTSKFENCPMVILEAKKMGIPCIAPRVGGIPEIVSNTIDGELYDTFSIDYIHKMIDKIIKNYDSYSKSCLKNSQEYESLSTLKKWNKTLMFN
ncbi:glycosyltransferase involved in cell wall biosynthesis [Marinifilum flexuosum]|uniref:Glycosyltransferase involved in cell wall biosynthesis n=2 Tax=Marinifilum flexuosum TaxID=1117708 RepID=A0A419XA23_9BACT|nr:glycosyltransferase involved in cell wall biosynthesis [Marinifilum flexuosum]